MRYIVCDLPTGTESSEVAGEAAPAPGDPPRPASVLEALQQRLAKYTEQRDKARVRDTTLPLPGAVVSLDKCRLRGDVM